MAGTVTPFSILKEMIDPLIDGLSEDASFTMSPVIQDFDVDDSVFIQSAEASFADIYGYQSNPTVYIGDRTQYTSGNHDMKNGRIKMKKVTEEIRVNDDEYTRMKARGEGGLIARNVVNRTKRQNITMMEEIVRCAIQGVRDGDKYFQSPLGAGDGGTIDDPYDLNATAGTELDLSALIFSGSQQTSNNMPTLMQEVWRGFTKIDGQTKIVMVPRGTRLRVGMHPDAVTAMENTEIINDTTGERGKSFVELFADRGVSIAESVHFDPTYDGEDGSTSIITFYAPVIRGTPMFRILMSNDPENKTWTDWEKFRSDDGKVGSYFYVRNKALELGFHAIPNLVWDSTNLFKYYKPVFRVKIKPYDDTA